MMMTLTTMISFFDENIKLSINIISSDLADIMTNKCAEKSKIEARLVMMSVV